MFNYKFNFGSIFGGAVCAVAAGIILYLISNHTFPPKFIKFVAMAGLGGAALGNWIWSFAAPGGADVMWETTPSEDDRQESA